MQSGVLSSPERLFAAVEDRLHAMTAELENRQNGLLERKHTELAIVLSKLEALNPLSVLARGFGVVEKDGRVVRSAKELVVGDSISLRLSDGNALATVNKIE